MQTSASGELPETHDGIPRTGRREWIGLAVLTLPTLLIAMDLTVLHLAVLTAAMLREMFPGGHPDEAAEPAAAPKPAALEKFP